MAQVTSLIHTLKKQLKAHGKTYADLAPVLDLSEASVKRLFAEEHFSLQRLERICHLLDMELSDLVLMMTQQQQTTSQLTVAQEEAIASDLLLLLVTVCVISGYSYQDLIQHFDISASQCIQKLAALDRLKLIELLPNNRIKRLVSPDFSWLPNGPIQRFFQAKIEKEFFQTQFNDEREQLLVLNGVLSKASIETLHRKLQRLAKAFAELSQADLVLDVADKHGVSMVLATRGWNYPMFEQFSRGH